MSAARANERLAHFASTLQVGVASASASASADPLAHVPRAPLDPILGTNILFRADKDPRKVNLGIGAYRTDEGVPFVLESVRKAEQLIINDKSLNKEYLPQEGHAGFLKVAAELLLGKDSPALKQERVATIQTLSGTGALRIACEFLAQFLPKSQVLYSEPTWGNHKTIFQVTGLKHTAHRYWDNKKRGLDINGLLEDFKNAPEGSVVLLHACAHNPTGVDPTEDQWKQICTVMQQKKHIPFFDSAYQGFATGDLQRDSWAIRYFAGQGFPMMLICQSFAKNMGLYAERIGSVNVVASSKEKALDVFSQLNAILRPMYSNPPAHGAYIVHRILSDPALYKIWDAEMRGMSQRISNMRTALRQSIEKRQTPGDWSHITSQIGMFSYTGLSVKQCEAMIAKHHIYMLKNGRISMAGVNSKNVDYIAAAIDDVVRNF